MPRTNIDKRKIFDLYQTLQSDTAVAAEVGCSVVYAARVMQQFGRPKIRGGTRNPHARSNANKIIDHIIECGGTIKSAKEATSLKVCDNLVYEEAKQRGVTLGDYRYYQHSRGVFTVQEPKGFYRTKGKTFIPATCNKCRATYDLTYAQLFYTKRPTCACCGAK